MSHPFHISGSNAVGFTIGVVSYVKIHLPNIDYFDSFIHLMFSIVTAFFCGVAGFLAAELMKWIWKKLGLYSTEITMKISNKKKGFSFFNFFNKKK